MGETMRRRSAPARAAGGALAIVVTVMLTGCFANPLDAIVEQASEETAKNTAEELIEGMTGGEAGIELGGLPEGFPEEIPLVSDNILQSMTMPEGTMVVVEDPRNMGEVAAQVKSDFADWEEVAFTDMEQLVSAGYKKGSLGVNVSIMGEEGSPTRVGYIIPNEEAE